MLYECRNRARDFLRRFSFLYFAGVFNRTIIPLVLAGYEMIITNSVLRPSMVIYNLISITRAHGIVN